MVDVIFHSQEVIVAGEGWIHAFVVGVHDETTGKESHALGVAPAVDIKGPTQ